MDKNKASKNFEIIKANNIPYYRVMDGGVFTKGGEWKLCVILDGEHVTISSLTEEQLSKILAGDYTTEPYYPLDDILPFGTAIERINECINSDGQLIVGDFWVENTIADMERARVKLVIWPRNHRYHRYGTIATELHEKLEPAVDYLSEAELLLEDDEYLVQELREWESGPLDEIDTSNVELWDSDTDELDPVKVKPLIAKNAEEFKAKTLKELWEKDGLIENYNAVVELHNSCDVVHLPLITRDLSAKSMLEIVINNAPSCRG